MKNKYFIGWKDINGAEIVDGPKRHNKNNYTVWKIKCPFCENAIWTKPTFTRLKNGYICRSCMYEKNKVKNDTPSKNRAFNALKVSAKKRGLNVSINFKQFLDISKKNCYYCNANPAERGVNKPWQEKALLNGIDRKNNKDGYSLENCVPCCTMCNRSKNKYSLEEWEDWIVGVYHHLIERKG